MKISHSKYKNTGLLFELLVRTITADTLAGIDSQASKLLKKYFVKTELGKEYKLYETLLTKNNLPDPKAEMVINTLIESHRKLNQSSLKRNKYNLISEIKEYYNLDEFFSIKIPHYKLFASFYLLNEANKIDSPDIKDVINFKSTLLEHLTVKDSKDEVKKDELLEDFKRQDKETKILTQHILLERFNNTYSSLLSESQKIIIREYIESTDSTQKLRNFYNNKIINIKEELVLLNKRTTENTTKIKIEEIIGLLVELDKKSQINDENLINLLQYSDLLDEMRKTNG